MAIVFRTQLGPTDPGHIEQLVQATGFFSAEEVRIATELAEDGANLGMGSHYQFELATLDGGLVGYACFGRIPCTVASWDLYWICVAPKHQGTGLGRRLLTRMEERVRARGGRRIYADTSTRAQYLPTRAFYERAGYAVAASFPDFYAPGDGKSVYLKVIAAGFTRQVGAAPGSPG